MYPTTTSVFLNGFVQQKSIPRRFQPFSTLHFDFYVVFNQGSASKGNSRGGTGGCRTGGCRTGWGTFQQLENDDIPEERQEPMNNEKQVTVNTKTSALNLHIILDLHNPSDC